MVNGGLAWLGEISGLPWISSGDPLSQDQHWLYMIANISAKISVTFLAAVFFSRAIRLPIMGGTL